MIGKFNFTTKFQSCIGPIEAGLQIPKVEKLDACIRPLLQIQSYNYYFYYYHKENAKSLNCYTEINVIELEGYT